ncbi:MAG: DUF86 domain-containing protein [Magnetococcales bacterium]|nr:DUF86 domain-containing protein [Magnetococcales bacterium]
MPLLLTHLHKAQESLQSALWLYQNQHLEEYELHLALRDSVVKRFEITYELCWKLMQRWLDENVSLETAQSTYSRKELFRLAARRHLIDDPLPWFTYHQARNAAAHTYKEANAELAVNAAKQLVVDAKRLLERLEEVND